MENETGAGRAQYFSIFGKVFLKMFEFSSQKILQDCVLAAKAIYDGVVFLARSCGGATRSSAPSAGPASEWIPIILHYYGQVKKI